MKPLKIITENNPQIYSNKKNINISENFDKNNKLFCI